SGSRFSFLAIDFASRMGSSRIKEELDEFTKNPPPFCIPGPVDNVRFQWRVTVVGPPDTPYEGAEFPVSIHFPPDYPDSPPKVTFVRKIYHPNISSDGECINLDILHKSELSDEPRDGQWSSNLTISEIFSDICSLLTRPDLDRPTNPGATVTFKKNRSKYDATVRTW
ncbi:hypothetical protein M569_08056, partial [Genlisea aurea]